MKGRAAPARFAVLLGLTLLVAGCSVGGAEDPEPPIAAEPVSSLAIAIAASPGLDPLAARDRTSRFVARQIFEPLGGVVVPPFGSEGRRNGLALGTRSSRGDSVWTLRLRRGVRFSDGSALNGSAVAANARRWSTATPPPLPGLVAADSPRSDRVRLIFSRPVADLPDRLDDPRLGIVSPRGLRAQSGGGARFTSGVAAGTGAFLVESRTPQRLTLARNPQWWGAALGLGPALRRVAMVVEPEPGRRLEMLAAGRVRIADQLAGSELAAELERDPLLSRVRVPRSVIGLERSVRGVSAAGPGTPLSGVWLTTTSQAPPGT